MNLAKKGLSNMTHDTKIYLTIADKKIFISQKKLEIAQRNKNPVRINIHNGKIVKKSGNNKWQVLLLAGGNRYRWFISDWGDDEYLDTSQYLPLPPATN